MNVSNATIDGVSDTAFWVAHYRGVETGRPDALFRDPLAAVLAGDRGRRIANSMPRPFLTSWVIAVRTRIIDDFIQAAVAEGVDTVFNLGAGLDTRPYRMHLPASLTWIEADYPHVIAYKEERLAQETPHCKLTRVRCDLADLAARRQLFATTNALAGKLLVLTEGLIPYLTAEDVAALADDLRGLDHAAGWIVDFFSPELIKARERMMAGRLKNAPFKFRPDDWSGFFAAHGWRPADIRHLGEEADRIGRPIELPLFGKLMVILQSIFMAEVRRDRFRNAAGYAMLKPASS